MNNCLNQMSQAEYQKSVRGARNLNQGKMLEDAILKGCATYEQQGLARITRVPEHFRVTKLLSKGLFQGRFIANAEPDFLGTLAGGRCIVFEAKATSKDRIEQNVLTKTQADILSNYLKLGAVSAVCIEMCDKFYFVPYEIFSNMKDLFGHKYMVEAELTKYRVAFDGAVLFLDKYRGVL